MNVDEALIRLGESTARGRRRAPADVRRRRGPARARSPSCRPAPTRSHDLPTPAVAASVSYVDGVTGGNVFVMPLDGARALAAAMMGEEPPEDEADELTELELSAVGEAMNQMMAAAAAATSGVLGDEVEIAPPETRVLASLDDGARAATTTRRTSPPASSPSSASRAGWSSSSRTPSSCA